VDIRKERREDTKQEKGEKPTRIVVERRERDLDINSESSTRLSKI
jgi:hypothetical protein